MPSTGKQRNQPQPGNNIELESMLSRDSNSMEEDLDIEASTSSDQDLMRTLINPLLILMTLCGQYYQCTPTKRVSCSLIFCIFITVFIWANCFRMFYIYTSSVFSVFMLLVLIHCWIFEVSISYLIFLLTVCRCLPGFFRNWDHHRHEYPNSLSSKAIRLFIKQVLIIFAILAGIMSLLFFGGMVTEMSQFIKIMLLPFFKDREVHVMINMTYACIHVYLIICYMVPVIFIFIISQLLAKEFDHVKIQLQHFVTNQDDAGHETLEIIRCRHLGLCKLVCKFDDVVSALILNACIIDVPIIALHVFGLMTGKEDFIQAHVDWKIFLVVQLSSCCTAIGHILLATLAGAMLSSKVSGYLSYH